ncbi:putative quinol monooxygenase [Flexibacterium corallicola]|uniref:putative quinol monooxygenase n=1 Tax=Flexibacterium corallicola TaxID=3037259 RepID=UPI00286F3314|nr:antibiotic biosynthesis monooxygenase [Pseudovibrio sp. M1P-2-3]
MDHSFVLFVTLPVKPECFEEAKAAILGVLEQTRAEVGCLRFMVHEEDGKLFCYEHWKDKAAHERHRCQPYMAPVLDGFQKWLERRLDVTVMRFVA